MKIAMLVLNDISLRRGVKLVLDHVSVTLQPGEKVGLVGRNGAGKSSLFALLTGRLQSDHRDGEAELTTLCRQWIDGIRTRVRHNPLGAVQAPATSVHVK